MAISLAKKYYVSCYHNTRLGHIIGQRTLCPGISKAENGFGLVRVPGDILVYLFM